MATIAILNEKPSQARNIAKNFGASGFRTTRNGDTIIIVHAVGHLYQYDTKDITKMVPADKYDKYKSWDLKNLPWHASDFDWDKLVPRSDVKEVLKNLKSVFSQCTLTQLLKGKSLVGNRLIS